jgi:hypothetical protein
LHYRNTKPWGCSMKSQTNHKQYVIDASKSWHIAWWAAVLGVSEDALLDAISLVGNESDAVEAYLLIRRKREQRNARSGVAP